jgi:hypothetical protein
LTGTICPKTKGDNGGQVSKKEKRKISKRNILFERG